MSLLQTSKKRYVNHDKGVRDQYRKLSRVVSYPPPATGGNFNLVDKVEHGSSDSVIWHIIHSPDGRFVYDYHLVQACQQSIKRMCFDCRRVEVRGIKRLCDSCANTRKRASNRKSQLKRRSSVRKTDFSPLRAEALTHAVYPGGSVESFPDKTSDSNAL